MVVVFVVVIETVVLVVIVVVNVIDKIIGVVFRDVHLVFYSKLRVVELISSSRKFLQK